MSAVELSLFAQLLAHAQSNPELSGDELKELIQHSSAAMLAAITARGQTAYAGQERQQKLRLGGNVQSTGRPSTIVYEVAMEGLWSVRVLGISAVDAEVRGAWQRYGLPGTPPTKNNMHVKMHTKGEWSRRCYLDEGEYMLAVRKLGHVSEVEVAEQRRATVPIEDMTMKQLLALAQDDAERPEAGDDEDPRQYMQRLRAYLLAKQESGTDIAQSKKRAKK